MAGSHGHLPMFSGSAADWDIFAEQLSHYFVANGLDDAAKKRAILLSACGTTTYKLLKTLVAPTELNEKSFAQLVKAASEHYNPKPSVIMSRFRFNTSARQEGESISHFVTRLRDMASKCEYEDSAKELIRDRLVVGVRDDALQRTLLAVANLTYDKAYELSVLHESATQNSRLFSSTASPTTSVHYSSSDTDAASSKQCYRCGGKHSSQTCRFKEYVCNYCSKRGHIQRACQSRLRQLKNPSQSEKSVKSRGPRTHKVKEQSEEQKDSVARTHLLEIDEDKPPVLDSPTSAPPTTQDNPPPEPLPVEYNVFTSGTDNGTADPYLATVTINGVTLQMEVDTGSAVTLISQTTYSKLWPGEEAPCLESTGIRLKTYSGEVLPVLGKAVVRVGCGGQVVEDVRLVVVGGGGPSLLGRDWLGRLRLDWGEVRKIHTTLDSTTPNTLDSLLSKHVDLFRNELGTIRGVTAKLHVSPDARPRFYRPRSIPYSLKSRVDLALDKLVSEGTLETVQFSDWAAPIVPVIKRDGSIRVCGDYKLTINQAALVDTYPLPLVQDIFASLANGQSFTKLDLAHAYQQLLLDDTSRPYTTINTHRSLFRYTRLPFGVAAAPAIFQRTMESLLGDIPHVCVYLDDILVTGGSKPEHLKNLATVLERLESAGVRLKQEKCAFMLPEVEYLGHRITAQGIYPLPEKVKAIREAPRPENVSQLRSFLGMLNYYGKFLPNLATLLRPLYDLLQSTKTWSWEEAQEQAFSKAKELLCSAPLLTHYDPSAPLLLSCDASPYGVGAVLSHRLENGNEHPIAFASRTLLPAEVKYSQLDKEALSIVFGVKHFHQYLYGRKFSILSDHKPLQYLLGETRGIPAMASARLQRWAIMLSAYQYEICYKPGIEHGNADGLSRLPMVCRIQEIPVPGAILQVFRTLESTPVTSLQVRRWTDTDPVLSRIRQSVLSGWRDTNDPDLRPYHSRATELSIQDGCVLWGSRVVIPMRGRKAVVELLHEQHPGITRMKRLARGYVWWPGIDRDLELAVTTCEECQEHQKSPAKAPMHPWEWPNRPWARIHVDYAGPIKGKMVLVIVDAHSKWMEALVVNSATSSTTINKLQSVFSTHGLPEVLVSDNGTVFTSEEFATFIRQHGIRHLTSAPYHPASNGLAERAVQTLKSALKKDTSGVSLETQIYHFLFRYRITPHSTTGVAPAELLLGRRPRSRLDLLHPDMAEWVRDRQRKQKLSHDQHSRERNFTVGQPVWVRDLPQGTSWLPGTITRDRGSGRFYVCLRDGRTVDRHLDHMRPRVETSTSPPLDGPILPASELETPEQLIHGAPVGQPAPVPHPMPGQAPQQSQLQPRRSQRVSRPPERLIFTNTD